MLIINSGTVSSHRLRGYTRPSYNVISIDEDAIDVTLMYPGVGQRHAAEFDRSTRTLNRNPDLAGMFSKATWGW
jgi:hypothetical protein